MKTLKAIGLWIASFTWGVAMTLAGCLVAAAMIVTGHRPHRFHYFIYFEVVENWGNLGRRCFFVVNKNPTNKIKQHESGHGIQNIIFGLFTLFIINIPSCIRYWYREWLFCSGKKKSCELSDYDSVWFEGQATRLGMKYFLADKV